MNIEKLKLHIKNYSLLEKYKGIDNRLWYEEAPYLDSIDDFSDVFFDNDFSSHDWGSLVCLLSQKYFDATVFHVRDESNDTVETLLSQQSELLAVDSLRIDEDKSIHLDFTQLDKIPKKIEMLRCRKLETLTLSSCQEAFTGMHLSRMSSLSVPKENNFKLFTVYKCNKLVDFSFLKYLDKVLYLAIGGNAHLKNLDFLSDNSPVVILNLSESKVIKESSTLKKLKKLKSLKKLIIAGTKKEKILLRRELPHCFVGGFKWSPEDSV